MDNTSKQQPWYKKPNRVVLTISLALILIVLIFFTMQVLKYSQEISLENIQSNNLSQILPITNYDLRITRQELETHDDPSFGNPDATVVIVEFGDFECPFCARSFPTVRELQQEYQNEVLFIWRDLPLTSIHSRAQKAAEAGECAYEQGKFWEYHDKLFINQARLTVFDLKQYAIQLGLNAEQFNRCLDSGKYAREVNDDRETALNAGAQGTPTFFINGELVAGVIPKDTFKQIIDQFLAEN